MRQLKRIISWCLVPLFLIGCGLYVLTFKWKTVNRRVRKALDRLVKWNDKVLMGVSK